MSENQNNTFLRKVKKYLSEILLLILFLVFVSFANKTKKNEVYKDVIIKLYPAEECRFLEKSDIINIINNEYGGIINKRTEEIDINKLESSIRNNPFVKNAEVYSDLKRNLYVDVTQRTPILRVIANNNSHYYLDENGNKVPLSRNYTPKVIVACGNIENSEPLEKDLFNMAKFITHDDFLFSLIGQIYITHEKEAILIPRIGGFKIEFGDMSNLKSKFRKLKILYTRILPGEGWNKYSNVDLRFKKQIILNKK